MGLDRRGLGSMWKDCEEVGEDDLPGGGFGRRESQSK